MINDMKLKEAVECWRDGKRIEESEELLGVLLDLAQQVLQAQMPEKKEESKKEYPTRKEMTDIGYVIGFNQAHDLFTALIVKDYIHKDNLKLCKCRSSEGAMTVKRINEDFHQCPRCVGLFPMGYVHEDDVNLKELVRVLKKVEPIVYIAPIEGAIDVHNEILSAISKFNGDKD